MLGLLLILAGLVLSPETIAHGLRGASAEIGAGLEPGTLLLRVGLVVAGLYMLLLRALPSHVPAGPVAPTLAPAGARETVAFAALIAIAAGLRLYSLGTGIWFDEMLTWVQYMPLSVGEIASTFNDANNHVLYSILARLSLSAFGDSVAAFRLPAAIFGIASIVALYYFARRVGTTLEALFAVALTTVSFHHIWFSQNARGYTVLLFFAILSSSYLLDALRTGRPRTWLLFALAAFLGAYTHLSMALMCLSQFLIYLVASLRDPSGLGAARWNGLLYGFVPLALLTYLGYALVLPDMLDGALLGSGLQGGDIPWTNPLWAIMEIVNALNVGFAGAGVVLAAGAVLAVGLVSFLRSRPAVAFLFLLPTSIGVVVMTSIGYTLFPRFFFFAMGFAVVIVIRGAFVIATSVARLVSRSDQLALAARLLAGSLIVASSLATLRYVYLPKQDYAAAIAYIDAEKDPSDTVVAVGIADFPFNAYHGEGWPAVDTLTELEAILEQTDRAWVVYTMPVHAQSVYPDILARLERDFTKVRTFYGSLNGGEIIVSRENTDAAS